MENEIKLIRGDTAFFNIEIVNEVGEVYELQETDKLVFTVKASVYDEDVLIQKDIRRNIIIDHDDTKNLSYGDYVYDVQLTKENGEVSTVIPPTKFSILEEVNYD